jgi:radical SAM superfamily enzyme YgiQ (UPF0313 family)
MKKAGCFNIHLGIESGNDRILEKMKKNITVEQIRKAVQTIKSVGLSCSASFMIGYLSETREEILNTIEFAVELELNNCQFYITQPEPGTELYRELGIEGDIYRRFTSDPTSVDLRNNLATDKFSREELVEFVRLAYTKTNNLYKIKETKKC